MTKWESTDLLPLFSSTCLSIQNLFLIQLSSDHIHKNPFLKADQNTTYFSLVGAFDMTFSLSNYRTLYQNLISFTYLLLKFMSVQFRQISQSHVQLHGCWAKQKKTYMSIHMSIHIFLHILFVSFTSFILDWFYLWPNAFEGSRPLWVTAERVNVGAMAVTDTQFSGSPT